MVVTWLIRRCWFRPVAPTAYDRTKCRGCDQVADQRCEEQARRRADEQLGPKRRERVIACLEGHADDYDQALPLRGDRCRKQSHALRYPSRTADDERPVSGLRQLRRRQQGPAERRCLVEDPAMYVEYLRKAVAVSCTELRVAQSGVRLLHECGDVRGARSQALRNRAVERGREVVVEQEAAGGQHDRHRERERGRELQPDRYPVHPPSLRSR